MKDHQNVLENQVAFSEYLEAMSRLAHSELHLTFRDWSSSESEEESYMPDSTSHGNPDQVDDRSGDDGDQFGTGTSGIREVSRGRHRNNLSDRELDNEERNHDGNNAEIDDDGNSDHDSIYQYNEGNGHNRSQINQTSPLVSLPLPLVYNSTGMVDNTSFTETFSPAMQEDENSNSSTPPHLLNGTINIEDIHSTDWIPRILHKDYNIRQSAFAGSSFFKYHPEHEFCYGIPLSMQKYGLINMMNDLLLTRSECVLSEACKTESQADDKTKKRTFNQLCLEDMNLAFLMDQSYSSKIQQLAPTSFLKSGSCFSLPVSLSGSFLSVRFTDVDYKALNTTGYLQLGDVRLGFTGELVDILKSDLRYTKNRKFLIEGNVFSNLLRNKLVLSKKFNKCFDRKRKKCYTKENWKPFSMNRMGYIVSNKPSSQSLSNERTIINPVKPSKFPNGSLFHKLQVTSESKFDNFKLLSKWFEMPPLNQFINTPSPPTPPNRQKKCTNNPENLLVCKDCVNLMMSKFLFIKMEVDIHELFENSFDSSTNGLIYPDLIYKHRRRFHDYANRLMSKSNSNFRRHLERQMRGMTHTSNSLFNDTRVRPRLSSFQSSGDDDSDDEGNRGVRLTTQGSFGNRSNLGSEESQNDTGFELNPVAYEEYDDDQIDLDFNWEDSIDFPEVNNNEAMVSDSEENDVGANDGNDDGVNTSGGENDNVSDDERTTSQYNGPENSGMLAVWPLSAERFSESHPILDPDVSSNEGEVTDEEIDHPYNIIFTNDRSRRVSRLLFNINMASEQHRHRREPVSSLSLYKNGNTRMKTIFLACINRNTGELHILPGNLDMNMWSNEQNDGELFEDVETFNKVYKLFMVNNNLETEKDSKYSRRLKNWIRTHRKTESEEIKKLLMLQMLANPSIINGYEKRKTAQRQKVDEKRRRRQLNREKLNELEKKSKQHGVKKKKGKGNEKVARVAKEQQNGILADCGTAVDQFNDDVKEQLYSFVGETSSFSIDNDKVLTFQSGLENGKDKQRHGSLFSFEYA